MSRKHSLSELVSNGSDSDKQLDPSTKSRADYVRRGASKAMKRSLVDIAEDACNKQGDHQDKNCFRAPEDTFEHVYH